MRQFLLGVLLLLGVSAFSQEYTFKGVVYDALTKETLPGASVKVVELGKGSVTDFDGNFKIDLAKGDYTVEVFFIGYKKITEQISISGDLVKDFNLSEDVEELQEVVITAERQDQNVSEVQMSTNKLDIEEIKKLPAAFGEVDVVKTIELLPGVTTAGEGASGFNVRGGAADQNLILFDKAPVYVSSHLFGFFSVFNSAVVQDLTLYKGGIPANYGGRLSSILDVTSRSGDKEKHNVNGGVGLVSAKVAVDGPIEKGKSSYIVSARRSLFGYFIKAGPEDVRDNDIYFYDLNLGLDFKLNDKNKLKFSSYYGKDYWGLGENFLFKWGNFANTLAWQHTFNDKMFGTTSLIYSQYSFDFGIKNVFNSSSKINNYILDYEILHLAHKKHELKYGVNVNYYYFKPAGFEPEGDFVGVFPEIKVENEKALDNAIFISDNFKLSDRISIQAGLRYNYYAYLGEKTVYTYQDGLPKSQETIIDTSYYSSGETITSYHGLEPRLGIKIGVDSSSSIKMSYNRMRQNINLISNSSSGLPIDRWKLADQYIKPQYADQVGLGYFRNFSDNTYETSVEVYYKWMNNQMDYKDGADIFFFSENANNIETELLQGKGRAYGAEFLIRKVKGKYTGWLAYTLSRTERKIDGQYDEEKVNRGEWYVTPYDKTHDLTFVQTYNLNKRKSFSANFVFATGKSVTFPDGQYEIQGSKVTNYSSRNGTRIDYYHRLDLSYRVETKKSMDRRFKSFWTISVYNVYGRRNPYSYLFQDKSTEGSDVPQAVREASRYTEVSKFSILGSIIPTVTYDFKF